MPLTKMAWQALPADSKNVALTSALIAPPVSLDILVKSTPLSAVRILQVVQGFIDASVLKVDEHQGIGNYHFQKTEIIDLIIEWSANSEIEQTVSVLKQLFEDELPAGPKRSLAISHVYVTAKLRVEDFTPLIQASQYCLRCNLISEAVRYFTCILHSSANPQTLTPEKQEAYCDAVIGLCQYGGKNTPYTLQKRHLVTALQLAENGENKQNRCLIRLHLGQVYKAIGQYEKATKMFDMAWMTAMQIDSLPLTRKIVFATTDFLMWQGRMSEAIQRYEEVLGNLEELPDDEQSLQACAHLGWIYGKCGHTLRGLGLINAVIEKGEKRQLDDLIIFGKVVQSAALLDAKRIVDAEPIIDELLTQPEQKMNHYNYWMLYSAKAYILSCRKKYKESFALQRKAWVHGKFSGNFHYRGPVNFDYMDQLEEAGYTHEEMNFASEVERVIHWPDIYMQGIGYYYRAKRSIKEKGLTPHAHDDLAKSIELLTLSGAKLDLAFAEVLLGQHLLNTGRADQGEKLIKKAWRVLRFVNEDLFPEELKSIVIGQSYHEILFEALIELGENLAVSQKKDKYLHRILPLTMQLIGAQNGAFFILNESEKIEMIASSNIEPAMLSHGLAGDGAAQIYQVVTSGKEVFIPHRREGKDNLQGNDSGWQVIYPVKVQEDIFGTFLFERTLGGSLAKKRILTILKGIATQVAIGLDNLRAYQKISQLESQLAEEPLPCYGTVTTTDTADDIIGESEAIRKIITQVHEIARFDTSVLVEGETGVGKELIAQTIHRLSDRATGPFVAVSITALDPNLLHSELFGHKKGAFTNAIHTHLGRFEQANNGTLFLDEINSLNLETQAKLLRILEEKQFQRVGGSRTIHTNFRLIVATNQPLRAAVERGTFRSDLFYRLHVYPIVIPPLRDRKDDILPLVSYFIEQYNNKFGKNFNKISKKSQGDLLGYDWPGNVRELKHLVEKTVLSCKRKQLHFADVIEQRPVTPRQPAVVPLKEMERQLIVAALRQCGGKVSGEGGAAMLLEVNPQTLFSKMRRHKIQRVMPSASRAR
ncbi:MAG: sigma 54-interacting transcriptional regulator [Desulfopila sp.]